MFQTRADHDFSRMNTLGLLSIRERLLRLRYLVALRGSLHIAAPTGESMKGTIIQFSFKLLVVFWKIHAESMHASFNQLYLYVHHTRCSNLFVFVKIGDESLTFFLRYSHYECLFALPFWNKPQNIINVRVSEQKMQPKYKQMACRC